MTSLDDAGLLHKTSGQASTQTTLSTLIASEIDTRSKRLLVCDVWEDCLRLQGEVRGLTAALRIIGQKEGV